MTFKTLSEGEGWGEGEITIHHNSPLNATPDARTFGGKEKRIQFLPCLGLRANQVVHESSRSAGI